MQEVMAWIDNEVERSDRVITEENPVPELLKEALGDCV